MFSQGSFFCPHRFVYRNLDTPEPSSEEIPDEIGEFLLRLNQSHDVELLSNALHDWIISRHPEQEDLMKDETLNSMLVRLAHIEDVEDTVSPTEMMQSFLHEALSYKYPTGNMEAAVMERLNTTLRSPMQPSSSASAHRDAVETGNELIDKAEVLNSPRLTDLRKKLMNLNTLHDTYLEVSNKAALELVRREILLKKLLEGQGFHYSARREGEKFYYFDKNYTVFIDERAPELPKATQDHLSNLIDAWKSMGQHYDRSSKAVDRYTKDIEDVEKRIKVEEERVRQSL